MDVERSVTERGDPWFDDGNIVLLSEDSSVAFNVHRDVLARSSEIFQSMFEMAQMRPPADVELFEGCPVVRMYDSPLAFSNLIKALYDGSGASPCGRSLDDFLYTAGILRLATKYFIARLRRESVQQLMQTWAHTLRGHDEMVELAIKSPLVDDKSYPYVHPLHVLNLARETNVQVIMPSALYFLSLYPLSDILKGDHPKLLVDHPSCPPSNMSPQDLQAYTLMFQHRVDSTMDFIRRTCGERSPTPGCQKQNTCLKVFNRMSSRLSRTWKIRTGPLHFMVQVSDEITDHVDVCVPCRRKFRQDVTDTREEIWKSLPSVTGLPTWEQMEANDLFLTGDSLPLTTGPHIVRWK